MAKAKVGQITILLILAALFGGGGSGFGLSNLAVQLAALTILALNYDAVHNFLAAAPRAFIALVIATLALPLLQLVPLPPAIWSALPGRQLVAEAYSFADGPGWSPFTVNPARTLVAFISLIAPFTILAICCSLNEQDRTRVLGLIVGLGLLNLVPGIVEVLGGDGQSLLYPANKMPGVMFGLFANRNSTGLFLVCCLILLAALPTIKRSALGTLSRLLLATLLTLGVVLTQSRSSIALLILPAGVAIIRAISAHKSSVPQKLPMTLRAIFAAGLAGVILLSIAPLLGETRLGTIADRFEQGDGQRSLIWEDGRFAAERYWPLGAGMGTFDEVFQVDESLEYISPRRAGRAHNDYLELAIEAGALGMALAFGWALWIIFAAWRALATPQQWPAIAGTGILVAIALQSLLDFPLRNQTMLCIAAFALLLIIPQRKDTSADAAANGTLSA
ncbi:MAG: hypothetical protein B7Y89_10805 [Novosphingobium sp. 32-60-15]|uniref:O-antigen ligase family protein n=1 Tax=Novosphingobium sp. 32-60-15 TaxID=1970410 RepID=UPI000BDCDBB5|nr:O-antigen ligase family protein [Novosphingobium sp. 32-60-15]OYX61958.1 MAG: hypothetical protein B7Y89_10805 [Novosphingobium sp. 32-60-15]